MIGHKENYGREELFEKYVSFEFESGKKRKKRFEIDGNEKEGKREYKNIFITFCNFPAVKSRLDIVSICLETTDMQIEHATPFLSGLVDHSTTCRCNLIL